MDDVFACEVEVADDDLLHEGGCFFLAEAFFDGFVEVGVTEFGDDVGVIFGGVDLVQ